MSRAHLATRLAKLEAQREARLLDAWHRLAQGEQHALMHEATEALIVYGLVPPPDPTRPLATIAELRQTAPATLVAWGKATVGNPAWHRQHPDAMAALATYVSARVERYGHRPL